MWVFDLGRWMGYREVEVEQIEANGVVVVQAKENTRLFGVAVRTF